MTSPSIPRVKISKSKGRPLGKIELIAIALGGMIGGGIFSILGVSVSIVGDATPIAILLGGGLALCAAYSYSQLAIYYKDEGATYSFFKKTFPEWSYSIAIVGWLIIFGYISTLALYAFTFSSYFSTLLPSRTPWKQKLIAALIIIIFSAINLISVKGMGKIEDLMVYTKVSILLIISGLFIRNGHESYLSSPFNGDFDLANVIIVAAITFVAYEGFQLVISAYEEAKNPNKNVPSAIYWSIGSATLIYFILSLGALSTIPKNILIRDKEFALAAGATDILGPIGYFVVIFGALLATSSAINGTLFGASRVMAVIAADGIFPKLFSRKIKGYIPHYAIIAMGIFSFLFILTGGLQTIIEFGSITFIIVSFLMALSNFHIRKKTNTHASLAVMAMVCLGVGVFSILYYEVKTDLNQVMYIFGIYIILAVMAKIFTPKRKGV